MHGCDTTTGGTCIEFGDGEWTVHDGHDTYDATVLAELFASVPRKQPRRWHVLLTDRRSKLLH